MYDKKNTTVNKYTASGTLNRPSRSLCCNALPKDSPGLIHTVDIRNGGLLGRPQSRTRGDPRFVVVCP